MIKGVEGCMRISDIVKHAAVMLALDRVLKLPELGGDKADDNGKRELELLVKCANLVINEAAAEYVKPRKVKEVVAGVSGKVDYSVLGDRVSDIVRVKNADSGQSVMFCAGAVEIKTEAQVGERLAIEYIYTPPTLTIDDNLDWGRQNVSERILGYGTAAEFCVIGGMYEEAALWDKRYKDALLAVLKSSGEIRVKGRRWR